jgi:hypothetical protein
MTKDEALKLAQKALDVVKLQYTQNCHVNEAITAIKKALAQPEQEPVAWADKESLDQIANFDATIYAKGGFDNAAPLYTTPPLPVQPEERNFCQRCGKRTADLTTIHTCTPPQVNT